MGFFNWAAPMFHRSDNRWTDEDVARIAEWLTPGVGRGASLLDVGGGTGGLAVRLKGALGARVTVLDPTPEMVRYIPRDSGVEVVLGSAEAMPFDSATFDGILVSDAFHHFRDQPAAVREFARVVRPGGAVLVLDHDPRARGMRLMVWMERLLGEPASFLAPESMIALMAEQGISGATAKERGPSYHFLGRAPEREATD